MLQRLQVSIFLMLIIILSNTSLTTEKIIAISSIENNGEALLAIGKKIRLSTASRYELGLINGISQSKATEIIEKREEIISIAMQSDLQTALQTVPGIGEKTAVKLTEFLELD